MVKPISTSIFELFKIGPGPSSSHTIGPIRAALDFVRETRSLDAATRARADRIEVRLFGSLSATGRGHGTDRAIVAGLLNRAPEDCDPDFMASLDDKLRAGFDVEMVDARIPFRSDDLVFDRIRHDYSFSNTLVFRLFAGDEVLLERVYFSIGGGFVQCAQKSDPPRGEPVYRYANAEELKDHLARFRIGIDRLILENEAAITGVSEGEVFDRLDRVMDVMTGAVERGLRATGTLPGP
ncbi:MAG: L-serine ammonia-lyase, partial [Deltaproteobacteria bacterium]|nr:L-serine ammonia-lyase [Deltaproteobacteria bacterium]